MPDSGLNLLSVLSINRPGICWASWSQSSDTRGWEQRCARHAVKTFSYLAWISVDDVIYEGREWHMHLEGLNGSPNQITTCHPPAVLARSQVAASRWRGIAQLAFAAWCLHSTCTPLGSVQCPLITCRVSEDTTWHYYMNCTFFEWRYSLAKLSREIPGRS